MSSIFCIIHIWTCTYTLCINKILFEAPSRVAVCCRYTCLLYSSSVFHTYGSVHALRASTRSCSRRLPECYMLSPVDMDNMNSHVFYILYSLYMDMYIDCVYPLDLVRGASQNAVCCLLLKYISICLLKRHCNTLQHTATYGNTLQHTVIYPQYISICQGKLESRPTVTRLSLGCLILVRSLI